MKLKNRVATRRGDTGTRLALRVHLLTCGEDVAGVEDPRSDTSMVVAVRSSVLLVPTSATTAGQRRRVIGREIRPAVTPHLAHWSPFLEALDFRRYTCMCYAYFMSTDDLDDLDDLLARIHVARQRPAWRRRLFEGQRVITSMSVLRALRAVEHREHAGAGASIGDVAEYMAVEHSTASRLVGRLVESGLLEKSSATEDQRRCVLILTDLGRRELDDVTDCRRQMVAETVTGWPVSDLETLLKLLDRLAGDFERGPGSR